MNINRDNYEEYFLLYADNELSKTEKKVVEIFVQENADLKEEFLMIKLTVNAPEEDVKLTDKSFLIKNEPSFINENNYEQIFILYHDDELSLSQKTEAEKFITQNPKYNPEFELIGKAKLIPDNLVVYPDKKKLYRKEKSGKIIPLVLWRTLAAAVFIGFGLWITISYFNKNEKNHTVATQPNTTKKPVATEENTISKKSVTEGDEIASSTKTVEPKETKKDINEIKKPVLKEQKANDIALIKSDVKNKNLAVEEKPKEIQPDIDVRTIAVNTPIQTTPAIIENNQTLLSNNVAQHIDKIEPVAQNTMHVQTASYVSDAGDNNQNYVFYDVSADEFRKSKVGGFLKKVKRVVERNNPITRLFSGDEEQVAAK